MNEKLITALIAILLALGGWNLKETYSISKDIVLLKEKVSKVEKDVEEIGWNTFDGNKKKKKKKNKKKNK
jgi:hypothetical protein